MTPGSTLSGLDSIVGFLQGLLDPLGWLRAAWAAAGRPLFEQGSGFLTSTSGPLSLEGLTRSDTVVHYATVTRLIADGALAGVLIWAFLGHMWSQSAYGQHRLRLMLPRLLLAAVLINFSSPVLEGAVDLNRAFAASLVQAGALDLNRLFLDVDSSLTGSAPAPLALAVALGLALAFALLLVVYVLRYALLVVLAITAPLAALLFVLHETSELARQWSALLVTGLLMQPLQLLIIGIGLSLDARDLGLGPLRHAFALACLVLCFRVPGLLYAATLRRRGPLSGRVAAGAPQALQAA